MRSCFIMCSSIPNKGSTKKVVREPCARCVSTIVRWRCFKYSAEIKKDSTVLSPADTVTLNSPASLSFPENKYTNEAYAFSSNVLLPYLDFFKPESYALPEASPRSILLVRQRPVRQQLALRRLQRNTIRHHCAFLHVGRTLRRKVMLHQRP